MPTRDLTMAIVGSGGDGVITVGDMVNAQRLLIDHLGIDTLFCVMKQYGALQIVSPKEAAARLGIDGSGSWKHGQGEPRR